MKEGFSGYNVDWEPASGVPTADDAKRYAHFLTEFAEVTYMNSRWAPRPKLIPNARACACLWFRRCTRRARS